MQFSAILLLTGVSISLGADIGEYEPRYGTFVGPLKTLHHDVQGDVYAVDSTTIFIKDFNYDGDAPDAYFFAGDGSARPSDRGFQIPNERQSTKPLGRYRNRNLILKFPRTKRGQMSMDDIKWFSVWCKKYAIDFGHVLIPKRMELPKPKRVGTFRSNGVARASQIVMEDSETINIKQFYFDNSISDAIFVARTEEGKDFQVLKENGSKSPIGRHNRKTIDLKVPKEYRGSHIKFLGIWSPSEGLLAKVDFPHEMRVPPSLNSLR